MSRTRILVAALLAVVLAASGLMAPSDASSERTTKAAKAPAKPKVGQCRTTTFAQGYGYSDTRKPVSCSKPHRMRTFAVVTVPKSVNYKRLNDAQLFRTATQSCTSRFWKALGGGHAAQEQTAYDWEFFIPTKAERKKGARWMRCDLSILVTPPGQNSQYTLLPNLPFPMLGNRPITDAIRRCLSDGTHHYWTTCSRAHAARADQTFTIASPALPSQATITTQGNTNCPGKRTTSPSAYEWRLGNHVITCYSVTTS